MGQTYRENYSENGDALVGDFFIEDMSALAGELNGGLDRDNFAQADIVAGDVSGRPFTQTSNGDVNASGFAVSVTTTEWQGGTDAAAGSRISYSDWTADQDTHLDLHWSGEWSWSGTTTVSSSETGVRPDTTNTMDTITFRMVVDGVVLATAGPFDDACRLWSTTMVASIQVPAGPHVAKVECEVCRRIWQTGQVDGVCTNQPTVNNRILMILERFR